MNIGFHPNPAAKLARYCGPPPGNQAIFQEVCPPLADLPFSLKQVAKWYTWSPAFRTFLKETKSRIEALPDPKLSRLPDLKRYNYTFSIPLSKLADTKIECRLMTFVQSLYCMKVPQHIMLFTNLLDEDLDGYSLHRLFALFRAGLVDASRDEKCALYTPLRMIGWRARSFPLHADLYIPEVLFTIFDDVPEDLSGASIFVKFSALEQLMAENERLPEKVRLQITERFRCPLDRDYFQQVYYLLHGRWHRWVKELELGILAHQLQIKLHSGQGYMIHDRTWLHGRHNPRGRVSPRRLHRIIFNTTDLMRVREARAT